MLVQDFDFNKSRKLDKINSFLKENYGFELDNDASKEDLVKFRKETLDMVTRLKVMENLTPKDPELTKGLLILEGVELLLSKKVLEERNDHALTTRYQNVINWLSDFVVKNAELGDDLDSAVEQAMREYRSSKWRFPDYEVEFDVRKKANNSIANVDSMYEMGVMESEEHQIVESSMSELDTVVADIAASVTTATEEEFITALAGGMKQAGINPNYVQDNDFVGDMMHAYKEHGGQLVSPQPTRVMAPETQVNEYDIDDSGRNVHSPDARKDADSYLKKGPKKNRKHDWDNVTTSKGASHPGTAEPKASYTKKPKPGRGSKAVFDIPETKGRK